jgi:signal peptide peptidase SppA
MRYPHLAHRIFDTPLLIAEAKAHTILRALAGRLGILQVEGLAAEEARLAHLTELPARRHRAGVVLPGGGRVGGAYRELGMMVGPVAVIEVEGTLVNRLGSLSPYSGMTGYDGLAAHLHAALADPAVEAIAFDIESPGGEVPGCFDLCDEIHAARGVKPIVALVDGYACSAAYAIAAACGKMTVSETGLVGSVGVITAHASFAGALEKAGIEVTLIHAGRHKADGNPYEKLPESVRAEIQREVEAINDSFVTRVARWRGLSEKAVRDTGAAVFMADRAVKLGLADAVAAPRAALAALIETRTAA